ncbi:hypothetical protein [Pseudomonas fluorescens]|uniref:Glycosyltransferase RgtA/B/C/D-like domain-containing protein n=1 Tax=Pseudomonas fluorescens TaxID=294 RepID=A0A5E7CED6_PSEFL|nr:hypothetical protein [Pseudomonas fluorescens]VVO03213.1 hypothetical protein PS710_02835 [Pseudomonas fluorescens]
MKLIKLKLSSSKKTSSIFSGTLWAALIFLLLLLALMNEYILPRYFFYDSRTISSFIKLGTGFASGDSFSSTAAFYTLFGVERNSIPFSLVSFFTVFLTFNFYLKKSKARSLDFFEFTLIAFLAVLSMAYMTALSKELIVLLFIAPFIFFSKRGLPGLIAWSFIALAYAFFFRTYWFLLIAMFWGIYIVFRFSRSVAVLIAAIPIALFALAVFFVFYLGVDLDSYRTLVNDVRIESGDEDARTMILPWVQGGGVLTGWLNSFITWITLMVPLPLFLLFSPYHMLISVLISILFYKFWKAALLEFHSKKSPEKAACFSLVISFTALQCIFEPDYGSYVKHLSPFFPMIVYAILKDTSASASKGTLKSLQNLVKASPRTNRTIEYR